MMDMEYNRTSPFISNCLHYSSEFHPYVGEFFYFCPRIFGFKGVFVDFMRHHVYMYFDYFIDYQRISYLLKS